MVVVLFKHLETKNVCVVYSVFLVEYIMTASLKGLFLIVQHSGEQPSLIYEEEFYETNCATNVFFIDGLNKAQFAKYALPVSSM